MNSIVLEDTWPSASSAKMVMVSEEAAASIVYCRLSSPSGLFSRGVSLKAGVMFTCFLLSSVHTTWTVIVWPSPSLDTDWK